MALRDKVSDISCDKQTDIQNYINAFDINEDSIDFETLSNYDDSSYVLNAYNLNNLNNNINNMQDNWNDNVNNYLDDKAELFQSWIDNLGKNVRPWNNVVTDKNPYLFRRSANGSLDYPFDREIDKIVGGTVAWNQLVNQTSPITLVKSVSRSKDLALPQGSGVISGHKYIFSVEFTDIANITAAKGAYAQVIARVDNSNIVLGNLQTTSNGIKQTIFASSQTATSDGTTVQTNGNVWLFYAMSASEADNATYTALKTQLIDLTQMFGSTIADYIYSIEQTTAGAGVSWLKAHGFCTKDYYAYDAGSLKSVKTSAHKTVGFNQWDEVWELGRIDNQTGADVSTSSQIRSKNYIDVLPNTTYYAKSPTGVFVYYYDASKGFISTTGSRTTNTTFTTPSNARFIRIVTPGDYGTTYNNDICINISDASKNGQYEPYEVHSYPLDSDLELRGIPKLDANNNLYADGDVYPPSGEVSRVYSEPLDLGTLDWSYDNLGYFYTSSLTTALNRPTGSLATKDLGIICDKYAVYDGYLNDTDNVFASSAISGTITKHLTARAGACYIYVKDSNYTDAQAFKTAMSGVYLVYKLATPTTEQADPFANPQIVDPNGTEEYVDTRDVPIPVGHETEYLNDDLYYYKNEIVSYSEDIGAIFLCLQDCNGLQPLPTASSVVNDYWLRIYNKGDKGLDSYDLNYIGEFNWEWEAFLVNDVVYVNNNDTIDFYVCISNVSYSSINTPANDTEHWICLFVIHKDGLMIYDEMPNQEFFDNPNSPSIFGVISPISLPSLPFDNNTTININDNNCIITLGSMTNKMLWFDYYPDATDDNTYTSMVSPVQNTREGYVYYILPNDGSSLRIDLSNMDSALSNLDITYYVESSQITSLPGTFTLTRGSVAIRGINVDGGPDVNIYYDGNTTLIVSRSTTYSSNIVYFSFRVVNGVETINLLQHNNDYEVNLRFYNNQVALIKHTLNDDMEYLIANKKLYEYYFPNQSYIKIVFQKYAGISFAVKFIDRINSESASNPQYLDVRQLMNASRLAITSTYTSSISNAIKELIQQHNLLNIFNIAM